MFLPRIKSFTNHFRTLINKKSNFSNTCIYELPTKYNFGSIPIIEKEKCIMCHSSNKCPFNSHYPCYPNK